MSKTINRDPFPMSNLSRKYPTSWAQANGLPVIDWQQVIDHSLALAKEEGKQDAIGKPLLSQKKQSMEWENICTYGSDAIGQLDERIRRKGPIFDASPLDGELLRLGYWFFSVLTFNNGGDFGAGKELRHCTVTERHSLACELLRQTKEREKELLLAGNPDFVRLPRQTKEREKELLLAGNPDFVRLP